MKRISENDLFMNAFNFSAIGMAIVSMDGRWLKVNSSLCEMLGYSEEELEQMTFQDITYPDDLELDLNNTNRILNNEINYYKLEKRYFHKTGKIVWGHLSVSLVRDENQHPLYFITQIQDVTEQKVLKEKLEKSEERYRNWIQYSPEPMVIHCEGKIVYSNEASVKIIRANSYKDLIGKNITGFIHPDDQEMVLQRIQQMLTTNQALEPHHIKLIDIYNKEIDVRLFSSPIDFEEKKAIQVFFSDITQQKRVEEAIRKNEAQYKSLIEYNPDAVFGLDLEGNFTMVNDSCTRITGYSEEEFLDMSFESLLVDEDLEKAKTLFIQALQGKTETSLDLTIKIKNGNKAIVNVTSIPIIIDREIKGLYTVAKDVTEQKRIEKELQNSNDRFKAIFGRSGIGIILRNSRGKVVEVNPTYIDMLGYSEEEIYQLRNPVYQADMENERKLFSQLVKGQRDFYQMEKRYVRKDGKTLFTNITVTALKNHEDMYVLSMIHDISGRKQNEKLIEQSEERYRALVEFSPNAIIVHQEGKIVYANPQFKRLLKASSENDFIGQPIHRFVHPDYREIVKERVRQLERNVPVGSLEEKYVLLDGSIIDVEVIATPIEYMDKSAFQVIIHDISQRKEIERELNRSQEQSRSVLESVKEVFFHTDTEGLWTFLSPAWEDITGFTIEESMGKPFRDYVYHEEREQNDRRFQSLLEGEQEYFRKEVRNVTKDGGYRWVEVFAKAAFNDQGEIIGTLGTLNDITKRKESEAELKASEERFRLLAEYSSDMITLHDVNGKYLYVSPASKEILQYDMEEMVGQDPYFFIHPDDQQIVNEHHQMLLKTGYTVSTYRIRRKDGEYVWFESSIKLLNEIHSSEHKLIVVSRDINERKLVEQRLQEANEILQQLSNIDGLTGIYNRRVFDERLEMEWNRGRRNSTPLSLLMIDIDNFKAYNDTYGHQGGDGCLKQVASAINESLGRTTDLLCRYGGEEFCVILPETDEAGAKIVAEKIRNAIENLNIPHAGSKVLPWVTISVGIATMVPTMYTPYMDLISNADKAVYKAKNNGRNCVRTYE